MPMFFIDTNAGPVLRRTFRDADAVKAHMEERIPLLRKRGYTSSWRRNGKWHVIDIANSKGRPVHSAAFCLDREAPKPTTRKKARRRPRLVIGAKVRFPLGARTRRGVITAMNVNGREIRVRVSNGDHHVIAASTAQVIAP